MREHHAAIRAVTRAARERLRRSFRPEIVKVLFFGESPPAAGTFFYAADSELYRSTRDVFEAVVPACKTSESFLACFASLGCYLVDLCLDPVNQLTRSDDGSLQKRLRARRAGEGRLAKTLMELQPQAIVVLLKGIVPNVRRAAALANSNAERFELTYPSRWHHHRVAYRRELATLLRKLKRGAADAAPLL